MLNFSNYSIQNNVCNSTSRILNTIRENTCHGITRKQLQQQTGYSSLTVIKITSDLTKMGAIRIETAPPSGKKGRPQFLYYAMPL